MNNTDLLFGRGNGDLLIGNLGRTTLVAGAAGHPDRRPGQLHATNNDMLIGETGDDVNIWAPGDGSDA